MDVLANVIGQKIKLSCNNIKFVSNTKGFIKFIFSFTSDWDNLIKIAQFSQNGVCYESCLDSNGSVSLPQELTEGEFTLSLYAEGEGVLARTLPFSLKLERSIASDDNKIKTVYQIITSKISSTVANPIVNYSVLYNSEKNIGEGVAVTLDFTSWLEKDSLGTGVKLTVFAKLNDGEWRSVVLKENSEAWRDTRAHTSSLTLSSSIYSSITNLDFYISRVGSTASGLAGIIGDLYNPVRYSLRV